MFLGQRIDYNGRNDYWVSKSLYTYVIERTTHSYFSDRNVSQILILED